MVELYVSPLDELVKFLKDGRQPAWDGGYEQGFLSVADERKRTFLQLDRTVSH
jgi:hypothetical protein